MNRQELVKKMRDFFSDARYYTRYARDWIRAHPKTSAAIAIALLSFVAGAYAFAASVTCQSATYSGGVLTCETGSSPNPAPVPTPIPIPPQDSCPAGTLRINGQFGNTAIETRNFGNGFSSQIMVVEVKIPANFAQTSARTSSWVEFIDGPVIREAVFSTIPCDFSNANALKDGQGRAMSSVGQSRVDFSFKYRTGSGALGVAKVEPGKTYYINVRNVGCGGSCNMRGGLPQ